MGRERETVRDSKRESERGREVCFGNMPVVFRPIKQKLNWKLKSRERKRERERENQDRGGKIIDCTEVIEKKSNNRETYIRDTAFLVLLPFGFPSAPARPQSSYPLINNFPGLKNPD